MKQKLKVELVNKFDAEVLDNHFYSILLEQIKVVKQNQVMSSRCQPVRSWRVLVRDK